MSPNPPITPSSTSHSNGSPLTAMTSPQSSGRSSSGHQKSIHMLPSSPQGSSSYRKKSFNSGPLPLTLSSDRSPMPSQAGSPVSSPYGSPPTVSANYISMLARKNSTSEPPSSFNPRELYRRSESYSTLQARAMMNHNNSSTDLNLMPSPQNHPREYSMRHEFSDEQPIEFHSDQDQYYALMQHHDHSRREKHKRESFYAALQGSDQNHGGSYHEEFKKPAKIQSRAVSPQNSNNAPHSRSRSKGSTATTPTAEQRSQFSPPPGSESRTPAGNGSASASASQTNLALPSQKTSSHAPRQASGEIQSVLRKAAAGGVPMIDETMTSYVQGHFDMHSSSSPSTPSNQSGEYQQGQILGEAIPVPVADITKHLSGLEFNEQSALAVPMQSDTPVRTSHLRKQSSGNMVGPHRRSIVLDGSNGRAHGSGVAVEGNHRTKESGAKDRSSMIANTSNSSSRKRGKVKNGR